MFPPDLSLLIYLLHQIFLALEGFGSFVFILILFIIIYLLYPEKVEKAMILINKAFAYASEKHERRYISKSIEHNINSYVEKFDRESEGILPYKIKVEWVNVDSIESYLRDNGFNYKNEESQKSVQEFCIGCKRVYSKSPYSYSPKICASRTHESS